MRYTPSIIHGTSNDRSSVACLPRSGFSPARLALAIAIAASGLAGHPARAATLLFVHRQDVVAVDAGGRARTLPFSKKSVGVGRLALHDDHRVLRVDRAPGSRAMGLDRIQVVDLRTHRVTTRPYAQKRVRHNRIIKLLRILPGRQGIAFLKLDNFRAVPFTVRQGKRRDLRAARRFGGRITALTVLPDGQHLVVHHPGFTRQNERRHSVRGYGDYLRGHPQTLYYGKAWGKPLRRRSRHKAFEWLRLVDKGRHAVYLTPGPPSKQWRRYALRSLELATAKERVLDRPRLPFRGHRSIPPKIYSFLAAPDLVVMEKRHQGRLRYRRFVAGRAGSQQRTLPAGHHLLEPMDCLAGKHTGLHPYLVTYGFKGRVSRRTFRYELRVIRVKDGRVVHTYTHVGSSPSAASYIP